MQSGNVRWPSASLPLSALRESLSRPCEWRPVLALCDTFWEPFAVPVSHNEYRRVYAIRHPELGRGTYGIVSAVAISVPWPAECPATARTETELRYVLAAMKTSESTRSHLDEIVAGCAVNDIVVAGLTPSLARLLDAFVIARMDPTLSLPPRAWKHYWSGIADYAAKKVKENGSCALDTHAAMKKSIGFSFYELSTYAFEKNHRPNNVVMDQRLEASPGQRSAHDPLKLAYTNETDLLADMYQKIQAVDALHNANLLHCDIHSGNFVQLGRSDRRTDATHLTGPTHVADKQTYFEEPFMLHPTLSSSDQGVEFLLPANYEESFIEGSSPAQQNVVRIPKTAPKFMLVDYGATRRCTVYGTMTHKEATRRLRKQFPFSGELPARIVSRNDPHYGNRNAIEDDTWIPPCVILEWPTTHPFFAPPEQFNPLKAHPTFVVHSTLSEVYSVCTTIASAIIGFEPFRDTLPVVVDGEPGVFGVPVTRNTDPSILAQYEMIGTPFKTKLTTTGRQLSARKAALCTSRGRTTKSTRYATAQFDEKVFRSEVDKFYRANPEAHSQFLYRYSKTDKISTNDMSKAIRSLVARIEAVGLPTADAVQGTFYQNAIRRLRTNTRIDSQASGWLLPLIRRLLNERYSFKPIDVDAFVTLLKKGLNWDPAARPPLKAFLLSPIFNALHVNHKRDTSPHYAWGADWPLDHDDDSKIATPPAGSGRRASSHRTSPLPFLSRSQEPRMLRFDNGDSARLHRIGTYATDRYHRYMRHSGSFSFVRTAHLTQPKLHSDVAERLFYLNVTVGKLDAHTGSTCLSPSGRCYSGIQVQGTRLLFANKPVMGKFRTRLRFYGRIPPWLLENRRRETHTRTARDCNSITQSDASSGSKRKRDSSFVPFEAACSSPVKRSRT